MCWGVCVGVCVSKLNTGCSTINRFYDIARFPGKNGGVRVAHEARISDIIVLFNDTRYSATDGHDTTRHCIVDAKNFLNDPSFANEPNLTDDTFGDEYPEPLWPRSITPVLAAYLLFYRRYTCITVRVNVSTVNGSYNIVTKGLSLNSLNHW